MGLLWYTVYLLHNPLTELMNFINKLVDSMKTKMYFFFKFRIYFIPNQALKYYVVLAGNKCDLPKDSHVIPVSKGKELAAKLNCHFYSTSAKLNKNITELFEDCAKQVVSGRKTANPGGSGTKKKGCNLL